MEENKKTTTAEEAVVEVVKEKKPSKIWAGVKKASPFVIVAAGSFAAGVACERKGWCRRNATKVEDMTRQNDNDHRDNNNRRFDRNK